MILWKLGRISATIPTSMNYAVIETGGKQYKINIGTVLEVDSTGLDTDSKITFDKVLLYVSDSSVMVGTPYIDGVEVLGKVIEAKKGDKIDVYKFRAKSKYRRHTGYRHTLSKVVIESIKNSDKKESAGKKEKISK